METIQLYNLNNLCRTCLSHADNMKNLFENVNADVFQMLIRITQFEIEKSDVLPNYMCGNCEEKLNMMCEFKSRCHATQQLLQKYISNDFDEKLDMDNSIQEVVYESSREDVDDVSVDVIVEKSKVRKQTMRLKQYSHHEVNKAIDRLRRKFFDGKNCTKCPFRGSNARALSIHISHVHKELKDRWCSTCNDEFDDLNEHTKTHGHIDDLKCQFCGKIFTMKGHLTEHLMGHTSIRPFKCDICDKCFISTRHLKIHHRTHSKIKPYKCHFCPRSFSQLNSFKIHEKKHPQCADGINVCAGCGDALPDEHRLKEHRCDGSVKPPLGEEESILREPQNFCSLCDRKVRSLDEHKRRFHAKERCDVVPDAKLCTACGKKFKTSSKLKVHMRIHTGEAPYSCRYCDKKHYTRNHLVVHERTHTGERPHVCFVCKKAFSQSSVLNTHMKLHTGRPEVCTICGQRFCRPAELKLHMRRHTGEKPYLCTECGQAFVQKSHLVTHLRIHSGERPHKCPYCERAFRQRSSLNGHIHIHLGNKPYRCDQCPYACRQSYSLKQHMKVHGIQVESMKIDPCCL